MAAQIKKNLIHLAPEDYWSSQRLRKWGLARPGRNGKFTIPRDLAILEELESVLGCEVIANKAEVDTTPKMVLGVGGDIRPDEEMFDYQTAGCEFLLSKGRCILADDTGLGKTRICINASHQRRTLIVAPLNKCQDWVDTIKELTGLDATEAFGSRKAYRNIPLEDFKMGQIHLKFYGNQFVVTNYESLTTKFTQLYDASWDTIVLEEAHYLQNRNTKRTKEVAILANPETPVKPMVWMLTATPVWGEPDTIWSLLNILDPIRFSSYWRFVESFCNIHQTKFAQEVKGTRADTVHVFKKIVAEYVLRREKADVLDLPDRVEHYVWLDSTLELRKESRTLRREMREYEGHVSLEKLRFHLLEKGTKKEALREILEKEKDKKIIVFVKYKRSAALAFDWIKEYDLVDICGVPITGLIAVPERKLIIEDFRTSQDGKVLLGTGKTLGTGLDLQCASVVIFLEHPFGYSELDQNYGRIERIGTVEKPTYYHIVQKGTKDEEVWNECMARSEIASGILK